MKELIKNIKLSRSFVDKFDVLLNKITYYKCVDDSDCVLGVLNDNVIVLMEKTPKHYSSGCCYHLYFSYELFHKIFEFSLESSTNMKTFYNTLVRNINVEIQQSSVMLDVEIREYNTKIGGRKYKIKR